MKPGERGTKKLLAKYGDGLVCVRYRYDEEKRKRYKTVELIVEDTGPGIPAEQRDTVLERFNRLPGTDEAGSGLGLAIVERIASVHDARLTLADREDGPGLRASVSIPVGSSAQSASSG